MHAVAQATSWLKPPPLPARHGLQDFMMQQLESMPKLQTQTPPGAFYIFSDVRGAVEPPVEVAGFGCVGDDDDLCR